MKKIRTPIIPQKQTLVGKEDELDLRAICIFAALGFFLDGDTYWKGVRALPPASDCLTSDDGSFTAEPFFKWHYDPRDLSLVETVDEFTELFEQVLTEQVAGRKVILPLSGGLDSRTQAAGLKRIGADVSAYSYRFQGGHDETYYASLIARKQGFDFRDWTIPRGYLWEVIDRLAKINGCYSEFTHPRQMAFVDRYADLGDVFSLGHWGDVLFDAMGVPDDLPFEQQVDTILKKIVKKGGLTLGTALWEAWDLNGSFREYLTERVGSLLRRIDIPDNANARIRAFKSMYWAPRWTSVNLAIFASVRPIEVPYYDSRVCRFICSVPENHLRGRKVQIEYLKRRAPALAQIPWQDHRPFNLYSYKWDKAPWNLAYRSYGKLKRTISSNGVVERNWELQFQGEENDRLLREHLAGDTAAESILPRDLISDVFRKFKTGESLEYSHSVSMLLTIRHFLSRIERSSRPTGPKLSPAANDTKSVKDRAIQFAR